MGWMKGFEPSASRATIWRANQLRHIHHLLGVPGGTRTPNLLLRRQLLYPAELQAHTFRKDCDGLTELEQVMGIEPTCSAWKADILPLNYTCGCQTLSNQLFNCNMIPAVCQEFFRKVTVLLHKKTGSHGAGRWDPLTAAPDSAGCRSSAF